MEFLLTIPDWLGQAILAAVSATLGFFGREIYKSVKASREAKSRRRLYLQQLDSLLQESRALFQSQRAQAQRLYEAILKAHPGAVAPGMSLDQAFSTAYDTLSDSERQHHAIIRGVTETAVHSANLKMSEWLETDDWFKRQGHKSKELMELSEQLRRLELHLNEWLAKYESVFTKDHRLALSYLAAEEGHGTGFPTGIERKVEAVLKAL